MSSFIPRDGVDVVEVEIAIFERVSRWNEIRLHQGLGYGTSAVVESEGWESNQHQEIIHIKENA